MAKPEEAANPVVNDSGEAKKKKKRNRKKKSKGQTDDAKSTGSSADDSSHQPVQQKTQASSGTTTAPSNMNPHAILRNRLMADGFSARQIDRAMEEMWDKNLEYDEYEAVLKYLKGEKGDSNKDEPKQGGGKSSGAVPSEPKKEKAVPKAVEPEDTTPAPTRNLKTSPPASLEQRLETVAGFENMTDAIFALTEWVSKAAKPRDLEDLCATTKTMALVTIFRRSITEAEDQGHFEKFVLPSMVRLVGSLLGKSGISSAAAAETQNTFEPLLKQARRIYLMQHPDAKDFAERVSRFIVSRISLAIGESNANMVAPKVSLDTSSASPLTMNGDKDIAKILSQREIQMTAAKRYGVMARSACASLRGGPDAVVNGEAAGETQIDRSDIMLALVGEDAKASYDLQKADLEELKAQAKKQESETAQELRSTIEELTEERETVRQRIFELKQSIENLETYDAELCVKVSDAQAELDVETAVSSAEGMSLNEKIQEATKALKYGTSVLGLVDSMKSYDDALDKAIHASWKVASMPDTDSAEFATRQMEVYISHTRSYFESETETMEYLRKRIETSTKAVGDLKLEIVQCEGLGMNTTIGQMKESLKNTESLIEKDKAMIERFSVEAATMFDAFIARLQEYHATQLSKSLGPLRTDAFDDIRSCLRRLGVESIDRLDPFMTTSNGSGPKPTDPAGTPKAASTVAPIGTPKSKTKTVEEKIPAIPKFTWATAKSTGDTGAKTSLLDIQKEELKSKEIE